MNEAGTLPRAALEPQAALGGLEVRSIAKAYDRRAVLHDVSLDVHRGEVVGVLSELLDIDPRDVATIGDMPSDLLMFARSGTSIAMANASTEVQRAATFVTSSNTDEGFARAMERWVLPRPGRMRSHISDRVARRSAPGLS